MVESEDPKAEYYSVRNPIDSNSESSDYDRTSSIDYRVKTDKALESLKS